MKARETLSRDAWHPTGRLTVEFATPGTGGGHDAWKSAGLTRLRHGLLAGLAGGLAEVAWIWAYAAFADADAGAVARGVTAALISGPTAAPVMVGLAIHMALAAALGVTLAIALGPLWRQGRLDSYGTTLTALAGVWAVNFLIVLPQLSPGFLDLLPTQVTLVSKLLFGLAAAWTFHRQFRPGRPVDVKEKHNVL